MTKSDSRAASSPMGYEVVFDGGSRGNPGPAYGSYRIRRSGDEPRKPVRLNLGRKTNNEAEYLTLIQALEDLLVEFNRESIDPATVQLKVYGDSQLVIRQLRGEWKAKEPRMRSLRDRVLKLTARFGALDYHHQARWRSVSALGH